MSVANSRRQHRPLPSAQAGLCKTAGPGWTLVASLLCTGLATGYVCLKNHDEPGGQPVPVTANAHGGAHLTAQAEPTPPTPLSLSPGKWLVALKLTSTLVGRTFRSAVINGRCVRVGDTVGPFRLAAIHSRHVILNYQDSPYRLDMRR